MGTTDDTHAGLTAAASHDDIERLASCVGLLVGEGGESENAGRAVGVIARRLGLTGGQLKRIFLVGAEGAAASPEVSDEADDGALRRRLTMTELAQAASQREIATLVTEKSALARTVADLAARTRRWRIATGVSGVALLLVLAMLGVRPHREPSIAPLDRTTQDNSPFGRAAIVRSGGTTLFETPDGNAAAALPAGTRLVVRRLLWKTLQQWAEVEISVGGRMGYVVTTGIDLS